MEGFDPAASFGDAESRRYDSGNVRGDEEQWVAFLAHLADGREALELAVGTGRIAVPLAAAGGRVDGIEISQDMVDRMREKPGGTDIDVTIGDMSVVRTGRTYSLVYLVYNTIGNLLTQDEQVRCSRTPPITSLTTACSSSMPGTDAPTRSRPPVRRHGAGRGRPRPARRVPVRPCHADPRHEPRPHRRRGGDDGPIRLRLAQPSELDLMARLAGLKLRDRWGGWNGEPFSATSWRHVSVYERATPARATDSA